MNNIVDYLHRTYAPLSIILYGSYADGSSSQASDFDALVISGGSDTNHDTSIVQGVQLDVFVYPAALFAGEIDCDEFIQIHGGKLLHDPDGIGAALMQRIAAYVEQLPCKSAADISASITWCRKMLQRTGRGDCEGMFRWHWLLTESLEIFLDACGQRYQGPKKALRWMAQAQPEAFRLYQQALIRFDHASLHAWVDYLLQLDPLGKQNETPV